MWDDRVHQKLIAVHQRVSIIFKNVLSVNIINNKTYNDYICGLTVECRRWIVIKRLLRHKIKILYWSDLLRLLFWSRKKHLVIKSKNMFPLSKEENKNSTYTLLTLLNWVLRFLRIFYDKMCFHFLHLVTCKTPKHTMFLYLSIYV